VHDCPHCGEPLEEGADSCPRCGSDDETGWNPDSDYYGVELPEDDVPGTREEHPRQTRELNPEALVGPLLVFAAGLAFFLLTRQLRDVPTALASSSLLLACLVIFYRWLREGARNKA
jgi:hypothetical protein